MVALLAAGAAAWFFFIRGNGGSTKPSHRARPACASARVPGHLGSLAWIGDGNVQLQNLDTCNVGTFGTMHRADVGPPVRFSPDGAWIAFGSGSVIPASIGPATQPLGKVQMWRWAPTGHTLVGVTRSGRVLVGQPGEKPTTVLFHKGTSAAIDPRGQFVAVGIKNKVELFPIDGGSGKVLFSGPKKSAVKIEGWSPDGRWVVFWDLAPGATAGALDVAPISGTGYYNVFDPVPAYDDFLTWCGRTLVASGGGRDLVTEGQQLLVTRAPAWQTHDLSRDFRSSWIWPSCAPNGRWIAVTVTPNHTEFPPGQGQRRVELISTNGKTRVKLALGAGVFELPQWSRDGRTLLVIKRKTDPKFGGSIELVRINPMNGKVLKTVPDVATLPAVKTPKGHTEWSSILDWYRG